MSKTYVNLKMEDFKDDDILIISEALKLYAGTMEGILKKEKSFKEYSKNLRKGSTKPADGEIVNKIQDEIERAKLLSKIYLRAYEEKISRK